jgi:hypothetical protein
LERRPGSIRRPDRGEGRAGPLRFFRRPAVGVCGELAPARWSTTRIATSPTKPLPNWHEPASRAGRLCVPPCCTTSATAPTARTNPASAPATPPESWPPPATRHRPRPHRRLDQHRTSQRPLPRPTQRRPATTRSHHVRTRNPCRRRCPFRLGTFLIPYLYRTLSSVRPGPRVVPHRTRALGQLLDRRIFASLKNELTPWPRKGHMLPARKWIASNNRIFCRRVRLQPGLMYFIHACLPSPRTKAGPAPLK